MILTRGQNAPARRNPAPAMVPSVRQTAGQDRGVSSFFILSSIFCLLYSSLVGGCGYATFAGPTTEDRPTATEGDEVKPPPRRLQIAGYTAGSVHPDNVHSVFVQVFASKDFRREIEFRLTEAIQKRISINTPYKITTKEKADTILTGEIVQVANTMLGASFDSDLPLENQMTLTVNFTWKNRRTDEIIAQRRGMMQTGEYLPLAGETAFDATEIAVNVMARRIVEAMEADW
jgi:hypothetical protein